VGAYEVIGRRHRLECAVARTQRATAPWRLSGAAAVLVVLTPWAHAQQAPTSPRATTLDAVEVLGHRRPLGDFPGSVTILDGGVLRDGQRQVSLAESLARVPGITVLDRQNLAQDLQVQSRGFGARSTFGIRGIKLIVDGIPASAIDGQGQAASFALGALDRIEVLRGPLSLQYGNAAGGAIIGYSDLDPQPSAAIDAWWGSEGSHRMGVRADGASAQDALRWRLQGSHFRTDGGRPHSAAERAQLDAIAEWSPREGEHVRGVLNSLAQPDTQDPLGLTREAWSRDPHGTDAAASEFNTRKRIDNHQLGLRWQRDYAAGRSAWLGGHAIERDVVQFLALPVGAQAPPGSAGGVIDLGRRSAGVELGHRWSHSSGALAAGVELSRLDEARRGYENFAGGGTGTQLGVRGRLRRDERNRVDGREAYVVADHRLSPRWSVLGALRHARLHFESADRYVAAGNGDDSGVLDYGETSAALGIARAFAQGEVFASVGRGFETPTITELAYRADGGPGFNRALLPSHYLSAEIGARWRRAGGDASIAFYRIDGDDEIVPADSRGGRASFANAGRTRRDGVEFGANGDFAGQWAYRVAANWLRARFVESFVYRVSVGGQTSLRSVAAGNRVPGIPRADGFAELAWRDRRDRFTAAFEARVSDRIAVDDRNTDAAPGRALASVRVEWRAPVQTGWHGFVRVDNLFDHDHVGSVIVNEGNQRFFEPGAGRSVTVGIGWRATR
jgi:iron complex outermembrane receptor protein